MRRMEWPTIWLVVMCYATYAIGTVALPGISLLLAITVTAVAITLHASLTHEIVHGHPFGNSFLNAALVAPALNPMVPFGRFRDTHLDHHKDANLTDPYDDPESNYLDPAVWMQLPPILQTVLRFNNTLFGRMLVGPVIGQVSFMLGDLRLWREGDRRVLRSWLLHVPALLTVAIWLIWVAEMPVWAYGLSVYIAVSILRIRTFLEHQAHERASGRTVIIEDRGILAFLFLNNNLHVVHHKHPGVAWYQLPQLYRQNKAHYQARNGHYVFSSYAEVFRRFFLRAKDPVPHPLRTVARGESTSSALQTGLGGAHAAATMGKPLDPGLPSAVLDKSL